MRCMTLKNFLENTTFTNGMKLNDLSLTEVKTIPDGWFLVGEGGYNGEYGDYGYVDCWASADHKLIIFNRYGLFAGSDEEEWSEITVHVAS